MGLYERLLGIETKIPIHAFMAAMGEVVRGQKTGAQAFTEFGLDAGAQTEATTLRNQLLERTECISLGGYTLLTNVGANYDTTGPAFGLGFCQIQCAGITGVELQVGVNKIGSGTQSWQLFDDTNAQEIIRVDDAGATGRKYLTATPLTFAPLGAQVRRLRMRAKSTTAADDPEYYGAALTIHRVGALTQNELHEVLCLAENGNWYADVASLKTRLGV
jgi:hypothetical protein